MGWVKHYDDRLEHGKLIEAGPLAEHLDDRAILWSNREMTDGFVPAGKVPILANWHGVFASFDGKRPKPVDPMELADRLVAADRWERVDGGFQIHDYLKAQRSKAQIIKDRDDAAKRQKAHRDRKRNGVTNTGRNGVTSAETDSSHTVTSDSGHTVSNGGLRSKEGKNGEQHEGRERAAA